MGFQRDLKQRGGSFRTYFFLILLVASVAVWAQPDAVDALRGEGISLDRGQSEPTPTPAAAPASLAGKPIAEIEVVGNVSMSRADVLGKVRARSGDGFDPDGSAEDARRIAASEGVEYAYYHAEPVGDQVKLTYVVVERNLIRSIAFSGNEKFKNSRLAKESGLQVGNYLDIFLVRQGIEELRKFYGKRGYAYAEITLDESKLNRGVVSYQVQEGPRVKVQSVRIEGNDSQKTGDLKKALKTKTRKWVFWQGYYNPEDVQKDVEKLGEVYRDRGYLDVQVDSEVAYAPGRTAATVTYHIDEGPVYEVAEIKLIGNEFFTKELLREETKLFEGDFYSEKKADFDKNKILSKYLAAGFIEADVIHTRRYTEGSSVVAEFAVEEGQRFRIGHITITGNETTHDKVIRRILDEEEFTPGHWYDAEMARGDGQGKLEKDLRQMVYAESAFIKATGEGPEVRNALVNIIEGQTGSVLFGGGVASDQGLIGQIMFDQRNFDITAWPDKWTDIFQGQGFKGAGQRLRMTFEPGTIQTRYGVYFTEPFLFDKPVSLDTGFSGYERGRESYDERRSKFFVALEKRYRDDWRRGIAFRMENIEVQDIDFDAPQEIFDVRGDNLLYGIRLFIGKDTTDDRYMPTKGYNFDLSYEQVGGDHNFGVVSVTQRWYKTLYEDFSGLKTVLETKLHGASVVGDAPPFEKFYAGGTGSLRGFEYRGVSTRGVSRTNPNKKDDPIGSDWIMLANTEVAVPLGSETFAALFFVDNGVIETGGLRSAVGTGIQILLPQWFGPVPMRFEIATPITSDDSDEESVFSFSVGALF